MSDIVSAQRYRRFYLKYAPLFKNQQVQAYTMVVLSLFAISFFGAFAIRPTLKTIALLKRQILDKNEVSEKLEQKINALISAQEEYQRVEKDLSVIYNLMPETAEFPLLLRRLENLVVVNSATISSITFDPIILYTQTTLPVKNPLAIATDSSSKPEETLSSLQNPSLSNVETQSLPLFFNLTLQGNYPNLVGLLDQLTKFDRMVTINSVDLSGSQDSTGSASLNLNIATRAYYYPPAL